MQYRVSLRISMFAMLAAAVTGCVVSEQPLFPAESAVTPLAAGRFEEQENKGVAEQKVGPWQKVGTGSISLSGKTYATKLDPRDSAPNPEMTAGTFTLFGIGGGFFAAVGPNTKPSDRFRYIYELLQKNGDAVLRYGIICSGIKTLQLPDSSRPRVEGDLCNFTSREALIVALQAYARSNVPTVRYLVIDRQ
jgi:hypothetical protein